MKGSLAVLLAALTATFGSSGCATVSTDVARSRTGPGAESGTVRVSVFDRKSQVAGGIPSARRVESRLSRLEGKRLVTVHESTESSWSLPDVPPGKYVFAVTKWVDEKGQAHKAEAEEGFHLSPGESAKIHAVLEDRTRNTAVTAVAVGGGAVVLAVVIYTLSHIFDFGSGKTTR